VKVGYVGLGAMGRALAKHLAGPYELIVWDINPSAIADLVAIGATAASSLADLARQCEIVVLCLPKSANVEQALFGSDGLAELLPSGAIVIDQTSGVPETTRAFADRLSERNIALIDAPVAGGVPSALAGQIAIMASGPADAFARARAVLATISPKLFHCSDRVGDGQATKAINNLVNTGYRMLTLELLGLARRMGCAASVLTDNLNGGEARSFVTQRLLPAVVEARSSADFALGLMCKDVNQAASLGLATRVPMPISDAARSLMNTAYNLLGSESRLDDLVPFMERVTGTSFTGPATAEVDAANRAMSLVAIAIAAGNRAIMLENIALADRTGLAVTGFGPVITAGSGGSVQAERLINRDDTLALIDLLTALDTLSATAASLGVPLTMTNQVRAHYLSANLDTLGTPA
jgi:3-hydroxyisobutyrate dehydrogenase